MGMESDADRTLTNIFLKWLEGIEHTEESREVPFLSVVMYVKT